MQCACDMTDMYCIRNALQYITTAFQNKNPHVKLLTAQGNLLSSLSFRDQMTAKVSVLRYIPGSAPSCVTLVDRYPMTTLFWTPVYSYTSRIRRPPNQVCRTASFSGLEYFHQEIPLHTGSDCYKVVLLTDDRNLRVKAHANDQPVRDLPDFMKLLPRSTR